MIFEILALALGIVGISFLITAPFNNILVRYRANYKPRRLHLSEEGDLTPPTGLNVSSFLGLFKRVYQVEVCPFSSRPYDPSAQGQLGFPWLLQGHM